MLRAFKETPPDAARARSRPPAPLTPAKVEKGGDRDRLVYGITDAWKQRHGLDVNKDIAEEPCASGLLHWEAFHLGCDPLARTTYLMNKPSSDLEVYKRGYSPLEEVPTTQDEVGDVTRIRFGLSGPGAGHVRLCFGPVVHVGPTPRVYALRSGEKYPISVERLANVEGGARQVVELDWKPVEGIMMPLPGYYGRFLVPEKTVDETK